MKKLLIAILLTLLFVSCQSRENYFNKSWSTLNDRVWVGSEFWSNRLQDWKIQNGQLECVANNPKLLMRTTHLINFRLANISGNFLGKVDMGTLQSPQNNDAASGFLIGAGAKLDVLGASLIQQNIGPGAGLFAGISSSGNLFIKDMEDGKILKQIKTELSKINSFSVEVTSNNSQYDLILKNGKSKLILSGINKDRMIGNIALVSHPGIGDNPGSFWFNNLEVSGSKLEKLRESIGPIISTQYTLGNNILKMTAQMAPIGKTDPQEVALEIKENGSWQEISKTKIITPGYTATFKVTNWNSSKEISYRVKYIYQSSINIHENAFWEGTIKHDPVEKEEIVIAAFTGNYNIARPGLSKTEGIFNFDSTGIWYPHKDIVDNIKIIKPDVMFFSGDQIYEKMSPTFLDTENYELDYLYKWYLYCLAYRDLTKDIPTISIPDDHDVYQGNLWGQNGRSTDKDDKGGYVHPAWFVKMVERTQCSNLPDPYDPTPIEQNIGVYYTNFTYGGIGFAVLEDRKFKSGCADNPFISRGRPDHIIDPKFDIKKIDMPGKKLLGERQLKFLDDWTTNWKGEEMKIVLSQTIFANMATHHGPKLFRLIADLDSDGWPQTGRNKAVDVLRKGFVFHLAGDQHLASIVHHGIDEWNDAIYSFCVPSIANYYPRTWWPENIGKDREKDALQNMGKHRDGFNNLVTVYAVTNPTSFTKVSSNHEPLNLHDNMPGYGIVKMNKKNRTITMECWPRYANPLNDEEQYKGWPKTISQFDNYGRKAFAHLPTISVPGFENPVVEIVDEKTGELVYCVRIKGNEFSPKVFKQSSYKIIVKDTERELVEVIKGILPTQNPDEKLIVKF
ncbi:MAG: alkaline phosphatase D family protein [Melioribacteraceae bacterium]|nr:alkaline phosphatase D family protein [Melioribacteraceae bacterium]